MERPEFHDDSTHLLHEGGIRASIKWEETAKDYVVLWYQDPFYKFGGFSMSEPLWEEITEYDHIKRVFVESEKEDALYEFSKQDLDEAEVIPSDHWAAQGDYEQYVIQMDNASQVFSLR